jgi:hypothetical protein
VEALATQCNWHVHSATCWKYLKSTEPHTDNTCRMRMDGSTRAVTDLDPETGAVCLRRLHPKICNYNDVCLYLFRCNMDIKFIGSGQAAKALMFYVTDYVTKSDLPLYEGLAALTYILQDSRFDQSGIKVASDDESSWKDVTRVINAVMSRREVSHAQVMADLLGHGDRYTSGTFAILKWGAFDRLLAYHLQEGTDDCDPSTDTDGMRRITLCRCTDGHSTDITDGSFITDEVDEPHALEDLSIAGDDMNASNQQHDYMFRPLDPAFNDLCLWNFVALTVKKTLSDERKWNIHDPSVGRRSRRGRPLQPRGLSLPQHRQHETHFLRKREIPCPAWSNPALFGWLVGTI